MRTVRVVTDAKCDIDGNEFDSEAVPTIEFEWDGQRYEIDICPASMGDHFNTTPMRTFVDCARPVKKKTKATKRSPRGSGEADLPFPCPVGDCKRRFKSEKGVTFHVNKMHPDFNPEDEGDTDAPSMNDVMKKDPATDEWYCMEAGKGHNFGPWKTTLAARRHYDHHHGPHRVRQGEDD